MGQGRWLRLVGLVVGAMLVSAVASVTPASADVQADPFGFTGAIQYFTVPDGVHQVRLVGWGGSGGSGGERSGLYAAPGGSGAQISLDAPVNPGDSLVIQVGGQGGNATGASAGAGGGDSGSGEKGGPAGNVNDVHDSLAGGGGGGGTTVIDATTSQRFLIAGGGGGGGGGGQIAGYNGGQGGDAGSSTDSACDPTYGPGVYGSGLTGGAGGGCSDSPFGRSGISGAGETPGSGAGTGGGGGGGLIGGDGGAAGGSSGGGAGGGGAGTSLWSSATSNVTVSNGGPGNGGVVVYWTTDPVKGIAKTASFTSCCAPQQFTVPAGVTQLTITGWGGSGGFGGGNDPDVGVISARGGFGAVIRETVAVNPGDQLAILPGGSGGNGNFSVQYGFRIGGGAGGATSAGEAGGNGGSITAPYQGGTNPSYAGGGGAGGGGGTVVLDTTGQTTLLDAGGGGGGGGDAGTFTAGATGGTGGNAGSPLLTGNPSDGNGYYGSGDSTAGFSNGAGGAYASSGTQSGETAADSTAGNARGAGGGGGGGEIGGGAGQQCTGGGVFSCAKAAGGGGAGSSSWSGAAQNVSLSNSLGGGGGVTISWVEAAPQTITFTSTPPDHAVYGGSYTPTATGGASGNPVVFSIDPSTARACSITGGTVSFTGVGPCVIEADQAGNDAYHPAPQVQQTVTIAKAPQTIAFTSTPPGNAVFGGSYNPAATAGASRNPVVFSIDSSSAGACSIDNGIVSFTGVGVCTIDANQAGNDNYQAAPQVQQTVSIAKAPQTIAFTSTPPRHAVFGSYNPMATGGGSGNPVVFSIDRISAGTCSLSHGTVSFTGVGACVIDANQAGDSNYQAAPQAQQALGIAKAHQAISFTSTPPAQPTFGGTYQVTATGGGSGNPVVFSIDSASTGGACSLSGQAVSLTGVGLCLIDANQAGNSSYHNAHQAQQSLRIAPATLTVAANDQRKRFGAANPTLDATLSGYVAGQTRATSGVTGQPLCRTTATAASPGGIYPITCTHGSLAAAHYTFRFTAGTLAVRYTRTITGTRIRALTVSRGESVLLGARATLAGPLRVKPGGAVDVESARIAGPVHVTGAAAVRVCNATITGPTTITASRGLVVIGDDETPRWGRACPGNKFTGPVAITHNTAGVEYNHNISAGPLTIATNSGSLPPRETGAVERHGNQHHPTHPTRKHAFVIAR